VVTAKDTTKAKLLVSLSLASGTRIGPFEVITPLGAGGMGEVYRAKDTRLGRTVALKVLPESFFEDKERVARFEREAKLLASLSHPNIAALYSFEETEGRHGIAMELLEGETLRETLRGGALPPGRAVEIGSQIARGLAAAHAKGIVHRDLKPENVFVTKDRRVKILDFGLAKLSPPKDGGEDLTSAGTRSLLTEAGAVFGTVSYMSPEQVRGESVDARSDLFALGTILCEMLTGRHVFRRGTAADTMSAILKEDPSELPVRVPASLSRVVSRLLEKMPEDRFQSASDLGFSLEALSSRSGSAMPAGESVRPRRGPRALVLGGALAALALVVVAFTVGKRAGVAPVVTYKRLTFQRGRILSARFAPDGQTILYTASWEGRKPEVYSTRIDSTESRPLGLPDVSDLFSVSPSAELLVRHRTAEGKDALAQVPLSGGAPRDLVEGATGASWAPDGKAFAVLLGQPGTGARLEFPAGRVLVATRDGLSVPAVSPDGGHVAFLSRADISSGFGVDVVDTAGKRRTLSKNWNFVFPAGLAWSPKGDEVWFAGDREGGTRWLNAVSLAGRERVVTRLPDDVYLHDVFRDGRVLLAREVRRHSLVVLPPGETSERDLSWLDYSGMAGLTADGRQVAIVEFGEGGGSTYSTYLRKTDGSPAVKIAEGAGPLSPDGRFVFGFQRAQPVKAYIAPTGPGAKRELPLGRVVSMSYSEWFPDGRSLIFTGREAEGGTRVYTCDAVNPAEPRSVTPEGFSLWWGSLPVSPDGKTFFAMDEKGRPVLIPVGGGPAREIPGVLPGDEPMQWMDGGKTLLVKRPRALSLAVYRLDLATRARTLFRELAPQDLAGMGGVAGARFTPDGRSYGYSYFRTLSDLYLVEGLR
jgi:eukaryotic-like serine/threonine-protein kinase